MIEAVHWKGLPSILFYCTYCFTQTGHGRIHLPTKGKWTRARRVLFMYLVWKVNFFSLLRIFDWNYIWLLCNLNRRWTTDEFTPEWRNGVCASDSASAISDTTTLWFKTIIYLINGLQAQSAHRMAACSSRAIMSMMVGKGLDRGYGSRPTVGPGDAHESRMMHSSRQIIGINTI